MEIKDLIKKLEKIEQENGNVEVNIYKSFDKKTISFDDDDIHFDDNKKDCYIGIYN